MEGSTREGPRGAWEASGGCARLGERPASAGGNFAGGRLGRCGQGRGKEGWFSSDKMPG